MLNTINYFYFFCKKSYADIVSYTDYVWNIMENFGKNITNILYTNENLFV